MRNLAPQIYRQRLIFEGIYQDMARISLESIKSYLIELSKVLDMQIVYGPIVNNWAHQHDPEKYGGCEAWVMWVESGTQVYTWEKKGKFISIDMYSCKKFDVNNAVVFTREWFGCIDYDFMTIPETPHNNS